MGLRFQRRVRILPGLHLNLSRSGVGFSVGGRGAHVGITARGQRYTSISLPGTGISWREYHKPHCDLCQQGHAHIGCFALACVIGFLLFLAVLLPR